MLLFAVLGILLVAVSDVGGPPSHRLEPVVHDAGTASVEVRDAMRADASVRTSSKVPVAR